MSGAPKPEQGVVDGVERGTSCQDIGWGVPGICQWNWQQFSTSTATSVFAAGVGTAETTRHPKLEKGVGGEERVAGGFDVWLTWLARV